MIHIGDTMRILLSLFCLAVSALAQSPPFAYGIGPTTTGRVLDTSKDGKVQLDEIRAAQAEMFTRQRVVQVLAAIAVAQIRRRG